MWPFDALNHTLSFCMIVMGLLELWTVALNFFIWILEANVALHTNVAWSIKNVSRHMITVFFYTGSLLVIFGMIILIKF